MTLTELERIQELYRRLGVTVPSFIPETWPLTLLETLATRLIALEEKTAQSWITFSPVLVAGDDHGFTVPNTFDPSAAPVVPIEGGRGGGGQFNVGSGMGGGGKGTRMVEDLQVLKHLIDGSYRRGFSVAMALHSLGIEFISYESGGTCELGTVRVYSDTIPAVLPDWLRRTKVGTAA